MSGRRKLLYVLWMHDVTVCVWTQEVTVFPMEDGSYCIFCGRMTLLYFLSKKEVRVCPVDAGSYRMSCGKPEVTVCPIDASKLP